MYDRILAATDGSEYAQRATSHALDLARVHGADLHAVYVVETRTGYDNAIVDPAEVRANLRAEGEAALAAVDDEAGDEVTLLTEMREGVPHEELDAYVTAQGIDLVVVAAKGRSAFKTALLGSTAEALLRRSDVPVLVVDGDDGD